MVVGPGVNSSVQAIKTGRFKLKLQILILTGHHGTGSLVYPGRGTMYEIAQDESTTCHQKCSSISVSTGVRFDDLNVGMPSIG